MQEFRMHRHGAPIRPILYFSSCSTVPQYHKEIEQAMLMEAALDLFSMGLPVHLHDSVVSRYILVFL